MDDAGRGLREVTALIRAAERPARSGSRPSAPSIAGAAEQARAAAEALAASLDQSSGHGRVVRWSRAQGATGASIRGLQQGAEGAATSLGEITALIASVKDQAAGLASFVDETTAAPWRGSSARSATSAGTPRTWRPPARSCSPPRPRAPRAPPSWPRRGRPTPPPSRRWAPPSSRCREGDPPARHRLADGGRVGLTEVTTTTSVLGKALATVVNDATEMVDVVDGTASTAEELARSIRSVAEHSRNRSRARPRRW